MLNDPREILSQFGIQEGTTVADLGVGYGHTAFALSEKVGDSGKVFAIDIQKNLLERISKEAVQKGIKNIEIIWGDIETLGGTKLREGSVDTVIISNVLFQVESKAGLVNECARIMKIGGRVLLIDWYESFGGLGPQPESVVDEDTARRVFETGPFEYKKSLIAGEHHYALVFERKTS